MAYNLNQYRTVSLHVDNAMYQELEKYRIILGVSRSKALAEIVRQGISDRTPITSTNELAVKELCPQ